MNLYLLVEAQRTEPKIYPEWLKCLIPGIRRIRDPFLLNTDTTLDYTFFIFSGEGFPSLLNHLKNAINDINKISRIDYLVIYLDSNERTVEQTRKIVYDFIKKNNLSLSRANLVVIVQDYCIETWLLGNRRIYHRTPTDEELLACISHYDVHENDPELMRTVPQGYNCAQYHSHYLKQIFKSRNISYTKKNPGEAATHLYLKELIKRNENTGHISSFGVFKEFCASLI